MPIKPVTGTLHLPVETDRSLSDHYPLTNEQSIRSRYIADTAAGLLRAISASTDFNIECRIIILADGMILEYAQEQMKCRFTLENLSGLVRACE